ncbi:IclR family transcriptional regulator [Rhizobium rhizogenes]|uniref:IclR family transcriptional regulator n=1 Tax=Rhizobium rhizogenes TaxID=359 RepID=UPI0015745A2F|nr:IclR family transcriptional regulator [Rhizobium rhizogenes]NTH21848.1 IclR family transcriptional regulator [Rhizobium rhizogenes]NTH34991.1 IclR family transcriptional regulator [Rhizobium rhizogenes]
MVKSPATTSRTKATSAPKDALESDRQSVTSLARGLEILNCFRGGKLDLSGSELAAMTGLPQPTVWRLCHTMMELGFLLPSSGDRMRPSLLLLKLGQVALAGKPLVAKSYDAIQDLARKCRGAVGLAAWNGSRMVLVQQGLSEGQIPMDLQVGSRFKLATSAHGWGFLAGLGESEREVLLSQFAVADPQWPKVEATFISEMKLYALRGYVLSIGSWHQGFNTVAAPILAPNGKPAFVLSCTGAAVTHDVNLLQTAVAPELLKLTSLFQLDLKQEM